MDTSELQLDPNKRRDTRSRLLRAKSKLLKGQKMSFCPYGCEIKDLDPQMYCDHLVGFTNESEWHPGATFEPMVKQKNYRVVQGWNPQPLLKTDHLEAISTSARVYRKEPLILPGDVRYVEETEAKVEQGKKQRIAS